MIKESKIKELVYEKVANMLDVELSKFGFKYFKSKKHFFKQKGYFNHIVNLYSQYSPISYNDKTEQLYLTFNISTCIEIPTYDKWHFDKFNKNSNFSHIVDYLTSQIELNFEDFTDGNFYTPSASQEFKRTIIQSFINESQQKKEVIPFKDLINDKLSVLVSNLSDKSDIEKIFESRKYPLELKYTYLLFFGGYTELAQRQLDKTYQYYTEEINNKLQNSKDDLRRMIADFDDFISEIKRISKIEYLNPYKRTIKVKDNQNNILEFSPKSIYVESLRLDVSLLEIRAIHVNNTGDILLLTDNKTVYKLNSRGEVVFENIVEPPKDFDKFSTVKSGLVLGTNDFFVNNYIITNENSLIELTLPVQMMTTKKLQNPHIIDLVYSNKTGAYLVLYENYFLVYSKSGQILKTIEIEKGSYNRIIKEKEWIVTQNKENTNVVINFDGQTIGKYEFGHGNNKYEFSTSFDQLICFSNSTKSDIYNLKTGKKGNLWAHPTFIKDYKEIMYNNTEHDFAMRIAKFSPDDKYIVGGASHGKYVAWNLPKIERIELLPKPEYLELFEPQITKQFSEKGTIDIITNPEFVTIDNQVFFKNRRNFLCNIIFLENGDLFLTVIPDSKIILVWNREFKNTAVQHLEGDIDLHCDKYLTQMTKTELVIYKQK